MRINKTLLSRANGPGKRFTIWVQGCSIHCKGCINPDTWDFNKGKEITVNELIEEIKKQEVDGVTITGGEPLDQYKEVLELCQKLCIDYNVFLTSGYNMQTISFSYKSLILKYIDILVSGPFELDKYTNKELWRGSTNQVLHYLTNRGKAVSEKHKHVKAEIFISADTILTTGFSIPQ